MGSVGIIIDPPGLDDPACHWQANEHVFVEALVAEAAIEGKRSLITVEKGA